jgi:hypothetical protein
MAKWPEARKQYRYLQRKRYVPRDFHLRLPEDHTVPALQQSRPGVAQVANKVVG